MCILLQTSFSEISSNDVFNGAENFVIKYYLTADETYYIVARIFTDDVTGTFTITIS